MYQIEKITADSPAHYFDQIAQIHISEIEQGFLSSLGIDFLRKFYKFVATTESAFLYGAVSNEKVEGFICGTTDINRFYKRFILTSGFSVAWMLMPKLISVRKIIGILETLLYPSKTRNLSFPSCEVINFCVRNESQRKGIGKGLFKTLSREFKSRGFTQIKIITGDSQKTAQNFYDSLPATRICKTEIHKNTKSIIYIFDIP